jgi:hypothetical protein
MSSPALFPLDRAQINRANAQHSTGPRTESGKLRSSLNALRHGLTARNPLLESEDHAAYQEHCRNFFAEYQPANATENQLVQEIADTSWRLNRIPLLEAELFAPAPSPESLIAHLGMLSLQSSRLARQLQRTLKQLRDIQLERRDNEKSELKKAAALLELHKHQGTEWDPADDGFVFSKEQIERHSQRTMRHNASRHIAWAHFDLDPALREMAGVTEYFTGQP